MRIIFTILLLLFFSGAGAQTIESLQAQIRKAEQEIRVNTALLEKNRNDQKVSQNELKLIRSRIDNRRSIVSNLEKQIGLIGEDINAKSSDVAKLDGELSKIRKEYADMIYESYKNYKLNNYLVFIFASTDFNDATRRVAYMRRYNAMRERKAAEIDSLSTQISVQITDLDVKRTELSETRASRNREVGELARDETQYQKSVNSLKANEQKLSTTLRQKQQQIQKAQDQIQKIIAEEARKNKAVKRTEAEEKAITVLSGRFEDNMGRLPYPVSGGVIIDRFGTHPHPTQKGLMVNNKGINIAAQKGSGVNCVFEGVVTRIFFFQGLANTVMVRHGNYITVYSNLAAVSVKTGDKVALNQKLGNISAGTDKDEYMVHFEIWKETRNLNPAEWLRR